MRRTPSLALNPRIDGRANVERVRGSMRIRAAHRRMRVIPFDANCLFASHVHEMRGPL